MTLQSLDHPFEDNDDFDDVLSIAIKAGMRAIRVLTPIMLGDESSPLPDRLAHWLLLWKEAGPDNAPAFHKSFTAEYASFIHICASCCEESLELWTNEDVREERRSSLEKYRIKFAPADDRLSMIFENTTPASSVPRQTFDQLAHRCESLASRSDEELLAMCPEILGADLNPILLDDALNSAIVATTPTKTIQALARISIKFLEFLDERDGIGGICARVGDVLKERFDVASLQLAAEYFRRARDEGLPLQAEMCVYEAAVRGRLAEIGISPLANLSEAVSLCSQARGYPATPRNRAVLDANEAGIRLSLARIGIDAILNLRKAVQLNSDARAHFDCNSENYAVACMNQGLALSLLATQDHAIPHVERLSDLHEACDLLELARPGLAGTSQFHLLVFNLANIRVDLADFGERQSENLCKAADELALFQSNTDFDHGVRGRSLIALGRVYLRLASAHIDAPLHYAKALQVLNQAIEYVPPHLSDWTKASLLKARALAGLAKDLPAALNLCLQVAQRGSPDPQLAGEILTTEASLRLTLAEAGVETVSNLRRVKELNERVGLDRQGDWLPTAALLADYAAALMRLAEMGINVEEHYREAVQFYDKVLRLAPPAGRARAIALRNRAIALQQLAMLGIDPDANLPEALKGFEQSVALLPRGDKSEIAAKMSVARLLVEVSELTSVDPGQACEFREQALCIIQQLIRGMPNDDFLLPEAQCIQAGILLFPLDSATDSQARWRESAEIAETAAKSLPRGTEQWAAALRTRARALEQLEFYDLAYEVLAESLGVLEALRGSMLRLSDRVGFFNSRAEQFSQMVDLCVAAAQRHDGWTIRAWQAAQAAKNRSLLDLLESPLLSTSEEDLQLWQAYLGSSRNLETLSTNASLPQAYFASDNTEIDQSAQLEQVERRTNALAAFLRQRDEVKRRVEERIPPTGVTLPSYQLVVSALRALATDSSPDDNQLLDARRPVLVEFFCHGHDQLSAFILPFMTSEVPSLVTFALPKSTIGDFARRWARLIDARLEQASRRDQDAAAQAFVQDLGILFEPWIESLEAMKPTELIFAPHRLLHFLPLHAAEIRGKPLIDEFPVSYLPSSALAPSVARKISRNSGTALLVANPTSDMAWSEFEVQCIATSLESRSIQTTSLVKKDATRDAVLKLASQADYLHLAGHAVLDAADFLESGLELADGRLTVLDMLLALQLPTARLVFLNGCNTGLSIPSKADELMALSRIFFQAGASSVVANLWPVSEDASATFAEHLYHRMDLPLNEAFHAAQLETRALFSSPLDWSSFVLIGGWR